MLASFAAKTFAAWTFRLVWSVTGVMPATWARRPMELFVCKAPTDMTIKL